MMQWQEGHVCVAHPRELWGAPPPPDILVHCRFDQVKGTYAGLIPEREKHVAAYTAAKEQFNMDAAFEIVERCIDPAKYDILVDRVVASPAPPRLIVPHPAFDGEEGNPRKLASKPTNALPFAYANYLGERLGCVVDEEIVQRARVGRTKLKTWLRFLCQPAFTGDVRPNEPYVLVDDVMTTGGTFAALRSYILRKGGTVSFGTALAHKEGRDQIFGVADDTVTVLQSEYGEGLGSYWLEAFGHDIRCLTQSEAEFLVWYAEEQKAAGVGRGGDLLQRLRDRIDQAAAKGG